MSKTMHGVFVTGTGTGVGKSVVAAALCAALVDQRRPVLASKPVLSGLEEAPDAPWPYDHDLLAAVTGQPAAEIAPRRFGPAVSPHLAARLAGITLTVDDLVGDVRARVAAATGAHANVAGGAAPSTEAHPEPLVVVEGAGGLLVPLDGDGTTMADLAAALGLPLVIAAHPGLGTINHVQLTLEAAAARNLPVAGVVLTPWPTAPSLIEADNREFLEGSSGLPILGLGPVESPRADHLAAAASAAGLTDLV